MPWNSSVTNSTYLKRELLIRLNDAFSENSSMSEVRFLFCVGPPDSRSPILHTAVIAEKSAAIPKIV
ncbi:uncharacterized protein BDZ99DRAFT_28378 [Mytilinidion resinicola]|uniref:Uncharacterized protein n=1 Tax=Mytilinidion resinicola TaxID=574789 RepID=A0A6A6YN44_9PEZI|nr:uncharacterized protein BDZ99DRAFT_28378 [Mytilinidion resinicola]KAF2809424.1 hypothetical protein BDZ99DRAFT_28378 [Mytilinidion resinicola]